MSKLVLLSLLMGYVAFAEPKPLNYLRLEECGHANRTYRVCLGKANGTTENRWILVEKNSQLDTAVLVESTKTIRNGKLYTGHRIVKDLNNTEIADGSKYYFEQRVELAVYKDDSAADGKTSAHLQVFTNRLLKEKEEIIQDLNIAKFEKQPDTRGLDSEEK